jgi:DNA polymerase V
MPIFALADCNNFYASCERVFRPNLENKPIVVLSNNDGCVISRSNEAKTLGIPMGAPYFKYKQLCQDKGVEVFSSNYQLYGDMSNRVMSSFKELIPEVAAIRNMAGKLIAGWDKKYNFRRVIQQI